MPDQKPIDESVNPPADENLSPLEEPIVDDAPQLGEEPPQPKTAGVHPLQPGGRRFEQVYAQGKQAQREAEDLKARLEAAETKLEELKNPKQEKQEYSWAELETFIQQGKITRADAEAHREEVMERKLTKKVKGEFESDTRQANRDLTLTQTLQEYVAVVPAIAVENSPDRVRLDEEFDFIASAQGLDPSKVSPSQRRSLQVLALRAVYGPIDSIRKRSVTPKAETSQGVSGGTPPAPSNNKDQALLNALTKPQVAHYRKMMAAGRYKGGWKDVVAELKYEPPVRIRR